MQAITMNQPGGPEVLAAVTLPEPTIAQATQILVKLHAAGVNPIDTKLRSRGPLLPGGPHVLGCDGAGVVVAVGSEVRDFAPGDEVYFCWGGLGGPAGNYAELAVVDSRCVALKPKSLSFAEAAAVPLVAITAWEALRDRGRLQGGQKVLIQAGAGGVGHVAIQLAKLWGAQVAATVSTADKAEFVAGLGCDRPILYTQEDVARTIEGWTGGKGVDLALDTVGGPVIEQTFDLVATYGDVVTLLEPAPELSWKVARQKNLRFGFTLMLTPLLQGLDSGLRHHASILRQCAEWIDGGKLKVHIHQSFALAEAGSAHRQLEAGGMVGKLVLTCA